MDEKLVSDKPSKWFYTPTLIAAASEDENGAIHATAFSLDEDFANFIDESLNISSEDVRKSELIDDNVCVTQTTEMQNLDKKNASQTPLEEASGDEKNIEDTTNVTFSSLSTPGKTAIENLSLTFNLDSEKGPFLLKKEKKQLVFPAMEPTSSLFTSTPNRLPQSPQSAAGDNTSIHRMHCELRQNQKVKEIEFKLNKALEESKSKTSEIEIELEELKTSHKSELESVKAQLEGELDKLSWQKADLERSMFDKAGDQFESLRAQFDVELTLLSLTQQVEIEANKAEFENELKKHLEARLAHVEIEKASEAKLVEAFETERLREEIDSFKQELQWSRAKLANIRRRRNEERRALVHQRKVDELTLQLANLKLKHLDKKREPNADKMTFKMILKPSTLKYEQIKVSDFRLNSNS